MILAFVAMYQVIFINIVSGENITGTSFLAVSPVNQLWCNLENHLINTWSGRENPLILVQGRNFKVAPQTMQSHDDKICSWEDLLFVGLFIPNPGRIYNCNN